MCFYSFCPTGYGSIIQMYPGGGPVRAATSCFGFPKAFFDNLHEFPLSKVQSLLCGTFSAEPEEIPLLEEESNGLSEEKQQETEEEPAAETTMEMNPAEEQDTMDIGAEEVEFKESKEKENKENVRMFIVAVQVQFYVCGRKILLSECSLVRNSGSCFLSYLKIQKKRKCSPDNNDWINN